MIRSSRLVFLFLVVVCAGALGFALARWTTRDVRPDAPVIRVENASDEVIVDARLLSAVDITIESATLGNLRDAVLANGWVDFAPNGEAAVTATVSGTILKIEKRLGDGVSAGEVLARLRSREGAALAAARSSALAKEVLARSTMEREQRLYEAKITPRQDLEAAQANLTAAQAEARSAKLAAASAHLSANGSEVSIVSPIAGRIAFAANSLGTFVQTETVLFRVANPRALQIEAQVSGDEATRLAPGDPAELRLGNELVCLAKVTSVSPGVDLLTRSATLLLSISYEAEPNRKLVPGEAVQVRIEPHTTGSPQIVVDENAVQRVDGHDVVFVKSDRGFKVRPVTVVLRNGGRVAVAAGIKPGELIAVQNAFFLKAELGKAGAEAEE